MSLTPGTFFNSPNLGLDRAVPGTFSLTPTDRMLEDLRRDYTRTAAMIIGEPSRFDDAPAPDGSI